MPILRFENLRLSWSVADGGTNPNEKLVVQSRMEYIGGCKITAVVGKVRAKTLSQWRLLHYFSN
jgi:hypothetical protein